MPILPFGNNPWSEIFPEMHSVFLLEKAVRCSPQQGAHLQLSSVAHPSHGAKDCCVDIIFLKFSFSHRDVFNECQPRPGATISVLAEVGCNEGKQTAGGILLPSLLKGSVFEPQDAIVLGKQKQR